MIIRMGQPDLRGHESAYVMDCLHTTQLSMGPWVKRFEREFADWLGVKHALTCANGTAALHLALLALGIGPGDKVMVPTLTYVATANAVRYCGADVVFCDVEASNWCLSVVTARQAWQDGIKAIIPVHLYGFPVDIEPLREFGVPVVEDAAEALGGVVGGTKCGAWGDINTFSFYGNKTLTTGEGGMVVTHRDDLAQRVYTLRGQGLANGTRYWHEEIGYNYRMTDLQAAIGCAQLERLEAFLSRRRDIAALYRRELPLLTYQTGGNGYHQHAHWAVAGLVPRAVNRDAVRQRLADRGIETRPVFYPLHTLPMYQTGQTFPNAEMIAARGLVLPTHTLLTDADIDWICLEAARALEVREYA